ncbi:MAG: hypothetical protein NVSMB55_05420 [Mycobacteriales bacterium]
MTYALGLLGSLLLAVGSFGAGAVPAGVWSLRPVWLGVVLCLAGLLLLLLAWWRLRSSSVRTVLLASGLWAGPLLLAAPLLSRDVYAYAGQAHLVDVGRNPYTSGPASAPGAVSAEVDDVWRSARSPYGPVFLRLASWLVPGEHVVVAVLLLRLLAVAGLALLAWSLHRLAATPARAEWLAVANPLVLLHAVAGAHNDVLMAGVMCSGLVAASGGSLALGAALVTVAALVKLPAIAALGFLPLLRASPRLRGAIVVAASAAVTAAVATAATGLGWGWVHTLGAGSARKSLLSVTTGLGVLVGQVTLVQTLGLGVVVLVAALMLLRARRIGVLLALGLTLLAFGVLSPVVQPWYLLWSLPLLAAAAGPRLVVGLAGASAVLCLLILPSGRHLIRPPLYGLPTLVVAGAGYAASRTGAGRLAT